MLSLVVSGAVAEGIVRSMDGGAFPRLRLFVNDGRSGIVLKSNATALVTKKGGSWSMRTGDDGLRAPSNVANAWLVVGDSQALGFGVDDGDTFAARATAAGLPMVSAGVPGYGVDDSLRRAEALLSKRAVRGVIVFVNQANDWEETTSRVEERYRVIGGWLVNASSASTLRARLLGSEVTRLHVLYHAVQSFADEQPAQTAAPPRWLASPDAEVETTREIAASIERFAAAHPAVPLVVCFLPVDGATNAARANVSPFREQMLRANAEPWRDRTLRNQLRAALGARPFVDLTPVLTAPSDFLDGDYHLSPEGHAAVASLLVRHITNGGRA